MPRLVAVALLSGCLAMRRSRCVSTVASTTNQTQTRCGRWAGRWVGPGHSTESRGRNNTRHKTAPQHHAPLRHTKHRASFSPPTQAATTTTSTPHMRALSSPSTSSPPTPASGDHVATPGRSGGIRCTSPQPDAKDPPSTHPLPPTASPSTGPADEQRHHIKKPTPTH